MKTYHILTLLVVFLFTGCLKEEKMSIGARIKVNMPEGFENMSPEGIDVKLYSTTSGLTYTSQCDASGIATFNVEYGFYEAVAQHRERGENTIDIFNGRMERIVLNENTKDGDTYTINLSHAKLQQLIIKEIYYAGCKKNDGKNIYKDDAYLSIYNNSDEVAYLDSLCIGTVNPVTSAKPSNFTKDDGSLWDEIPLFMMAWQFPGTGKDYPLQPGEETIIAINAINHADIASQSVDLSKANFAFWDPLLTKTSVPAPGVKLLNMIWRTNGTSFTISVTGPAMIIFKIPTSAAISAEAYAEDSRNLKQDPVTLAATQYLMIHKDWVIDGVECVTSTSKANKRIPNNIDAGFTYIPTSYLGNSVCRKVDEIVDGRIIYMDTNNSSEDFEVVPNTFKNR